MKKYFNILIIAIWALGLWYILHHRGLFKEVIDLFCIAGYFYFGKSIVEVYELNKTKNKAQ